MSTTLEEILVALEAGEGVATITLDRPQKFNALNSAMIQQFNEALDTVAEDPDVRAVVVSGTGKAFAAGADIAQYEKAEAAQFAAFTRACNDLCDRIDTFEKPVIAAVNGLALGGGFEIVLACDIVIAAESASFGLPEVSLGLLPGWGGTQRLPQFVGPNRARHLIMTAGRLSAAEANQSGIVSQICALDDLTETARTLATDIAGRAPLAVAAIKKAVGYATAAVPGNRGPGYALEQSLLFDLFASEDGREGIASFVQKRPARFTGR
ncbi:enoyl-CoA hydratase/isomerase family protein [Rhodococcus opacus]|uniref:enoyl-CoA hydratase/isomerase family protein n=1 Tax=Rhodococcus opacus TaxID=37919 RepID=UPI001F54034E|nr:enoyl-CoA hydratase-related protein [Rhodococcus opacus]